MGAFCDVEYGMSQFPWLHDLQDDRALNFCGRHMFPMHLLNGKPLEHKFIESGCVTFAGGDRPFQVQ